jgi:hypothetical protein
MRYSDTRYLPASIGTRIWRSQQIASSRWRPRYGVAHGRDQRSMECVGGA